MSTDTHPSIADAKAHAAKHDLRRCVILFELDDGRVGYSSYGRDRGLCKSTQDVIDDVFLEVEGKFNAEYERYA